MDADWLPRADQICTLRPGQQAEKRKPEVKPEKDLNFALRGPKLSNAEPMGKAYDAPGRFYVYGGARAIAGTKGTPFLSSDWMQNFKYVGIPWIKGEKVETEKTDRFQDNERARAAAPYTKKTIGHSLGGSVAIAERQKYGDTTGTIYSTPYSDPWGREAFKDFLDRSRKERNDFYKDSNFLVRAANWVQDKEQDFVEEAFGFDKQQGVSDTGFDRKRTFGDPFAALDNSAKTSWHTHPWDYMSFTHDYHDLAKDDYTADPTEAYGPKNEDGTINLRE